jgi:histone H2B
MEEELAAAMRAPASPGARGGVAGGATVRGRRVVVEEELPAEEEQTPAEAPAPAETEALPETQAEEPALLGAWARAAEEAGAEEPPPASPAGSNEAAGGAPAPAPTEALGKEEEAPPTRGRARGKRASPAADEPRTPAARLRGALAGAAGAIAAPRRAAGGFVGAREGTPSPEPRAGAPPPAPRARRPAPAPVPAARAPAAAAKRAPPAKRAAAKKARKPRREESYKRYIFKVLKQVHPDLGASAKAMAVLDVFVGDMFERVVAQAARLAVQGGRATLSAREVETAVRLVLPGELGKHAVGEGQRAVAKMSGLAV